MGRGSVAPPAMSLPLSPPIAPQLARGKDELPVGEGWSYEPKLDGFRAIAFVDGNAVHLLSRGGKALERYFPEITLPHGQYVLDGELIIDAASGAAEAEDFDALTARIHPAASRIERLSQETPARYVAFDLLADPEGSWLEAPFAERRSRLLALMGLSAQQAAEVGEPIVGDWAAGTSLSLIPAIEDPEVAATWLRSRFEGVIAKEQSAPYVPGARKGMVKIKRRRTADCVVVGWREGKEPGTVGSLILGLYDEAGELQVVGHTSGLKAKEKRELVEVLAPYATGAQGSADPSRWRSAEDLLWTELRPELVVEVSYDQVTAGRIRHGAKLVRWRDDKAAAECLADQLEG